MRKSVKSIMISRTMATILKDKKTIDWVLTHAIENIYPSKEVLRAKLLAGDRLSFYLGIDPTGPALHLGHAITIQKLAELQKLGHRIILLIGDFTAMIGDPTDKLATRKQLTREQVLENCREYQKQASKILNFTGPNRVEVKFNSEWLAKMTLTDVVELASHFTVQQMSERDMFAKRIATAAPVYLHEFLYPLMQGFDSVAMDVDGEVGGNDQTFNMLAGRTLMKEMKKKEKFVLTTRLLTDPTGKKMGKTEGNMINLTDEPKDVYGKVMSWTDEMIVPGFEICTQQSAQEVAEIQKKMKQGENPMQFKRALAAEVVRWLAGDQAVKEAEEEFSRVHQQKEMPEEIKELKIKKGMTLADVLVAAELVASKGEARRQIEQGGVKVNEEKVTDITFVCETGMVIQKGKRFFVKLV